MRGAIGGVGCAVLMPAVGAAQGHKDMGIIGGIIGGAGYVVLHGIEPEKKGT